MKKFECGGSLYIWLKKKETFSSEKSENKLGKH
jgi:hypothetical protein